MFHVNNTLAEKEVCLHAQTRSLLPLENLPSGARVLDVGCGAGTINYASYPHIRFIGLDLYPDSETVHWPQSAHLVLGSSGDLPIAAETFDGIIANFVFEHFDEPFLALQELDRVARPGCFLYLSVPRAASLHDRLYRLALKGGGHVQRYDLASLLTMVYRSSRFKLEAIRPLQSGFTWLQHVPMKSAVYKMLFTAFQMWGKAGRHPLDHGDYQLIFRCGSEAGYLPTVQLCGDCGAEYPNPRGSNWTCEVCGFQNLGVLPAPEEALCSKG